MKKKMFVSILSAALLLGAQVNYAAPSLKSNATVKVDYQKQLNGKYKALNSALKRMPKFTGKIDTGSKAVAVTDLSGKKTTQSLEMDLTGDAIVSEKYLNYKGRAVFSGSAQSGEGIIDGKYSYSKTKGNWTRGLYSEQIGTFFDCFDMISKISSIEKNSQAISNIVVKPVVINKVKLKEYTITLQDNNNMAKTIDGFLAAQANAGAGKNTPGITKAASDKLVVYLDKKSVSSFKIIKAYQLKAAAIGSVAINGETWVNFVKAGKVVKNVPTKFTASSAK